MFLSNYVWICFMLDLLRMISLLFLEIWKTRIKYEPVIIIRKAQLSQLKIVPLPGVYTFGMSQLYFILSNESVFIFWQKKWFMTYSTNFYFYKRQQILILSPFQFSSPHFQFFLSQKFCEHYRKYLCTAECVSCITSFKYFYCSAFLGHLSQFIFYLILINKTYVIKILTYIFLKN